MNPDQTAPRSSLIWVHIINNIGKQMRDQTTQVVGGVRKVKEPTEFENVVDCKFKVAF